MIELADPIFYQDDLLSAEECLEWIERTEQIGYAPAPVTTAAGPVMMPDIRNNERVMLDEPTAAEALWQRIAPLMPERWQQVRLKDEEWRCVGLNERLRFYRYNPGQSFEIHRDGEFRRNEREKSMLTLLVYLNSPDRGGATNVMAQGHVLSVAAVPGRALFFAHHLMHEGERVEEGRKYVLRSDVMYRQT